MKPGREAGTDVESGSVWARNLWILDAFGMLDQLSHPSRVFHLVLCHWNNKTAFFHALQAVFCCFFEMNPFQLRYLEFQVWHGHAVGCVAGDKAWRCENEIKTGQRETPIP